MVGEYYPGEQGLRPIHGALAVPTAVVGEYYPGEQGLRLKLKMTVIILRHRR